MLPPLPSEAKLQLESELAYWRNELFLAQQKKRKSRIIAAFLSFLLPGLGHLYCGKKKLGFQILIGNILACWLAVYLGQNPVQVMIVFWITCIWDSVRLVNKDIRTIKKNIRKVEGRLSNYR